MTPHPADVLSAGPPDAVCMPNAIVHGITAETVGPRARATVVLAARRSVVGPFLLTGGMRRTMTGMGTSLARGLGG